jgi:hypothetical protein
MIERKTFPGYADYGISIATEQMRDGKWAVVATVTQSTESAQRNVDLPVPAQRFESQAEAEEYGVRMAKEWIDQNTPKVA